MLDPKSGQPKCLSVAFVSSGLRRRVEYALQNDEILTEYQILGTRTNKKRVHFF
jgi:hypothetical protein